MGELLNELRELDLSGNYLEQITTAIYFLRNLEILNYSDNNLYEIPDWIYHCNSIKKLILRKNVINHIDDMYGN